MLSFLAELLQICSSSYSERILSGTAANCNQFEIVDSFLQTSTHHTEAGMHRGKRFGTKVCEFVHLVAISSRRGTEISFNRCYVLVDCSAELRWRPTTPCPLHAPSHALKNKARPEMKAKLWSVSVGCLPMTVKLHDTAVQQYKTCKWDCISAVCCFVRSYTFGLTHRLL